MLNSLNTKVSKQRRGSTANVNKCFRRKNLYKNHPYNTTSKHQWTNNFSINDESWLLSRRTALLLLLLLLLLFLLPQVVNISGVKNNKAGWNGHVSIKFSSSFHLNIYSNNYITITTTSSSPFYRLFSRQIPSVFVWRRTLGDKNHIIWDGGWVSEQVLNFPLNTW